MEISYFFDEMDGDIGGEERHEEPTWPIAIAVTCVPQV